MRKSHSTVIPTDAPKPNFFIIGAAKSGTSTIWHHLQEHPDVFMSPRKHTRFFAFGAEESGFRGPPPRNPPKPYAITDSRAYHALFEGATNETAIGEASWTYLYRPEASGRIQEYAPNAKIIAILRNPADRAFSHYRQNVQAGREPIADFAQALEQGEVRLRENWWPEFHYVHMGLYHAQLERYFQLFDRAQIKVYLYEDLAWDPYGLLRDAFGFLGVDGAFTPGKIIRSNPTGAPKVKSLHLVLRRLESVRPFVERFVSDRRFQPFLRLGRTLNNRNTSRLKLSSAENRRLIDRYFREDILALQDLIQRDLSAWLGRDSSPGDTR